ncbi:MAG: hypothetical protein OEU87_02515, partial [Nitrospira sp.]|nr:hypothetical protein [Nitrospira sp.]
LIVGSYPAVLMNAYAAITDLLSVLHRAYLVTREARFADDARQAQDGMKVRLVFVCEIRDTLHEMRTFVKFCNESP